MGGKLKGSRVRARLTGARPPEAARGKRKNQDCARSAVAAVWCAGAWVCWTSAAAGVVTSVCVARADGRQAAIMPARMMSERKAKERSLFFIEDKWCYPRRDARDVGWGCKTMENFAGYIFRAGVTAPAAQA